MEASCGTTTLKLPSQLRLELRKTKFLESLPRRCCNGRRFRDEEFATLRTMAENFSRTFCVGLSQSSKDSQACKIETQNLCACYDRSWLLKNKAQEVAPNLNERCIFLVGMMGSGKTTVGKVLAEALGYTFVDSDKFIEQAVDGGTSVRQIFQQLGETCFRNYESKALRQLASTSKLVVATGGGAVIQPINWEYMKQGITVWLDVPLDALAKRIAAVGTDSRPLLDFDAGDAYIKAFMALFTIWKKRSESYSNADTRVSLQHILEKLGLDDIADITPTEIAIEVLDQIQKETGMRTLSNQ